MECNKTMTEQDRKFIRNMAKRSDDLLRRVEALEKKKDTLASTEQKGTKEDLTVTFKDKDKALINMAKLRRDLLILCAMYGVQSLEIKYRV